MGATAKSPAGISGRSPVGRGASDFYANALNQQKQAVANVPATQAAQAAPNMPPNRPEPSFLNQPAQLPGGRPTPNQQVPGGALDDQYAQAYAAYMQRLGGVGVPGELPQQPNSPGEAAQQFAGFGAPTTAQREQSGPPPRLNAQEMQKRRKGITMGGGYANRSFG